MVAHNSLIARSRSRGQAAGVEHTLAGLNELVRTNGPGALADVCGGASVFALRPAAGGIVDEGGGTQRFRIPREMDETQEGTMVSPWAATAQRDTVVYPLRKSDRNPFAGVIAIGRKLSNDIVLASVEVSKVHSMVIQTADGWAVRDNGSRNGTFLNFERLAPNVDFPLTSGDQLRFAHIQGMFLDPEQLRTLLTLVR